MVITAIEDIEDMEAIETIEDIEAIDLSRAAIDLSRAPYYNSVKEELDKGYTELVFISGKAVQSRELSEIGSFAKEHTKRIANLLYKNGTIISGCSIQEISLTNETITMTPGTIFIDGEIFDIVFEKPIGPFGENIAINTDLVSKTIPIKIVGEETIFVEVVTYIVDATTDPLLLDPAEGFDNYQEPGASRLCKIARFISTQHADYNSNQFINNTRIPIYTLIDGIVKSNKITETQVTNDKPAPTSNIDTLDIIAQRNYETHGNYLAEGH
jgi:hypothetical protein